MNSAQFKYPVSHMCLAGTVVAPWSLTQQMAAPSPFTLMTYISVTEFSKFSKNIWGKLNLARTLPSWCV